MYQIKENTFVYSKSTDLSFWIIVNLAIPSDKEIAHMGYLGKLKCGWSHLVTPNKKYDLQSFPFLVAISMQET